MAVVHLSWARLATGRLRVIDAEWPYSERVTTAEFVIRFLQGGAHL